MTEEQLGEFRKLLEASETELQSSLQSPDEATAPVRPDSAIGRLTRQDAMQSQQMALELRRRKEQRPHQIDLSRLRLEEGTYGICACCEEEIAPARLRIKPEALLCVRCAQLG